ncbi:pentapeptide repeat-containing protein [Nostoc sp. UIC 10630]|uniref:pentapeptide repeat-containing protein n=1 Tax=Nostoc sp. UIC 10630 TaxID=2100146 RepID=UPI0013D2BA5B|nr:pentapeptide repeat-containing protein [Nostoc sp. UIC 10630]NEU77639.1 pentapeptide repeat-containing protein [Nostoc sp. UIC 10630]
MTDSSKARKNKKITYAASTQSIERAENALRRLGFESKSNFAQSQLISRSTVTKFFQGQPIQLDSFKRICKALKLNWAEIAGIIEEGQPESLGINSYSSLDTEQVVEQMQVSHRKVTVIDEKSKKIKAVITLEGDINSIDNWKIIESIARQYSGDSINILDIKAGSIRLIIEGSQEDIKRLASHIKSGELAELSGFPIENIQILNEGLDGEESDELDDKWRLVQKIVNHAVKDRNLRGADLSDADLSGADLSGADLSGADLSGADLSGANLNRANLNRANLSGAYLVDADLSDAGLLDANLSYANMRLVNWSRAYLVDADLRGSDLRGADLSRAILNRAVIDETTIISNKWRLVWEIVNQGSEGRDLSSADLSGANLSSANLSSADLSGAYLNGAYLNGAYLSRANLSRANLSRANLSRTYLVDANLSSANLSAANLGYANLNRANLSRTDLRGAYLRGVNMNGTDLSDANVENARFANNQGISESIKRDLIQKGAIFEDSLGDSSRTLLPH